MKTKDYVILISCSLFLGWVLTSGKSTPKPIIKDTIKPIVDTPIVYNVKDKTVLFIGDSHTANRVNGWQKVLSDSVGFKSHNVSVGGKTTYWMLEMAVYKITNEYDYVFVYGGANDMYSSHITPQEAVENIKGIVRMVTKRGAKCVVLTGFDPYKCTRTENKVYPSRYARFQELLLSEYMVGATVVDIRGVVNRVDCWDNLCHMNPNGHRKIAEKIIKDLGFKKI
jgi:lysophospholipase L1-like esterase